MCPFLNLEERQGRKGFPWRTFAPFVAFAANSCIIMMHARSVEPGMSNQVVYQLLGYLPAVMAELRGQTMILLIDDQESVRTNLGNYLERYGYEVALAADGADALRQMSQSTPELVVLDVQMPQMDGLDLCRTIRQRFGSIPILMISGERKELMDRIIGLEIGADKYLLKPFDPALLLAEVRALLRTAQASNSSASEWLAVDDRLRIHRGQRRVEVGGKAVHLTGQEFDLLLYLVDNAGVACSRDDLIEQVWKDQTGAVTDQAVNSCVARLRSKIESKADGAIYIESMYGWGYRFRRLTES